MMATTIMRPLRQAGHESSGAVASESDVPVSSTAASPSSMPPLSGPPSSVLHSGSFWLRTRLARKPYWRMRWNPVGRLCRQVIPTRPPCCRFYLATPHHAWERGTNENANGLIRQYLPKGQSMEHLTQHDCNRIAAKLNNRPRKRLGYRTPKECYGP